MSPRERYPALMAYVDEIDNNREGWTTRLLNDQRAAMDGDPVMVAIADDMTRALADFEAQERAAGRRGYPYNRDMTAFLEAKVHVPEHGSSTGHYCAESVRCYARLGRATREAQALIDNGRPLLVVSARNKRTRAPVRCVRFVGPDQIKLTGGAVEARNGKSAVRLSSNWSVETCIEKVVTALKLGLPYGETATIA